MLKITAIYSAGGSRAHRIDIPVYMGGQF